MDGVSCVERVSLDNLIRLRSCDKSLYFNELSLKYNGFETTRVVRKALGVLKEKNHISKETAFQRVKEIFYKEYLKEWFTFQCQYEQAKERDMIRVNRIIEYVYNNDFKVLHIDVPFQFKIKSDYNGYRIDTITGNVDFVFEKGDGTLHAVNFRSGENPYSHRARTRKNLEGNSMELLGTAIGLINRYKDKTLYVESWYLKNKDDKTNALVPEYENKKGKNIARIVADESASLWKRFREAATFTNGETGKCKNCIHKNVCDVSYSIREDENVVTAQGVPRKEDTTAATPKFTTKQSVVVDHMEGPMCVIAGPGAGKTFTLVNRLANMIQKGIKPENILVVTFTNKAANEFKERVMKLLNTDDEKAIPNIYTYNALGYTILKENPMFLGKRVRLADTVDRFVLINEALYYSPQIMGVSYDGVYEEYGLIRRLEKWFNQIDEKGKETFSISNSEKMDVEGIYKVYDIYKRILNERGYISYDMQISLVNELFSKYPSLIELYEKKFQYVMVDEFQDTSIDQAQMIYSIAKRHGNIVVVGDDDQSIYGWRGGSNSFMLNFGKDFPATRIIIMDDNFRSNDKILNSANLVISGNGERYEKELHAYKTATYQPIYLKNYTAGQVKGLVDVIIEKGYSPGDIAILARNHKRLQEVMDVLEGHYQYTSPREYLYEDPVFRTLYDVLTLYYGDMEQDEELYRFLMMVGVTGISKHLKTGSLYQNYLASNKLLPIDLLDENCFASYKKYKGVTPLMAAGYKLVACFKHIQYSKSLEVLYSLLNEIFGITSHKVIDMLMDIADERAIVTIRDLYFFMSNMKLYKDNKTIEYEPSNNTINLLTCHSAKGKEFPVVIVFGTEDFNSDEEEIRLFYVSITRAKNSLFFVETVCNQCELLPLLKGSVQIRGGA